MITLATIAWLAVCPAMAQTSTGSVRGTVSDETGAVIPGAAVVLTQTATNVSSRTSTNQAGLYVFPGVVPGQYPLKVDSAERDRAALSGPDDHLLAIPEAKEEGAVAALRAHLATSTTAVTCTCTVSAA